MRKMLTMSKYISRATMCVWEWCLYNTRERMWREIDQTFSVSGDLEVSQCRLLFASHQLCMCICVCRYFYNNKFTAEYRWTTDEKVSCESSLDASRTFHSVLHQALRTGDNHRLELFFPIDYHHANVCTYSVRRVNCSNKLEWCYLLLMRQNRKTPICLHISINSDGLAQTCPLFFELNLLCVVA